MNQKPGGTLKFCGWTSILLIIFGLFFKIMHWPGAGVCVIFGSIIFLFFYLPFWFKSVYVKERRGILIFQFFSLFLTGLCILFKIMHWPATAIVYYGWWYYCLWFVLPFSFFLLFKAGKKTTTDFHLIMVYYILGILIWGGLTGTTYASKYTAGSLSKNEKQLEQAIEHTGTKTTRLYALADQDSFKIENPELYSKVVLLNSFTKQTVNYLNSFSAHLIAAAEKVDSIAADTLLIDELNERANSDIPTTIICGWENSPSTGPFSGKELQSVINAYRDTVMTLINGENETFIKEGINLDTEPVVFDDGETQDWVIGTFRGVPLAGVLITIKTLGYEVKNAEGHILSDVINTAAKNKKGNFATKIADLGLYYENQKKQKDIESLKDQRELSQIKLDSKNEELDAKQQTLVWVVFGLMACGILIVYIIRTNIRRKKINKQLELQKLEIETKNKEITDSINYAKRIQQAILPPVEMMYAKLNDVFVLYRPKDVVSGDYYAFFEKEKDILLAVADCTGHGVPGAFMSMIGSEQLTKIIVEKNITEPANILNELHKGIRNALKQDQSSGETRDGMDIILCKLNLQKMELEYSGANRPLWIVRENKLLETKGDKQPIGGLEADYRKPFTNHKIKLQNGDCVYMFTDGFADQFGGDKGKKFMVRNFEKLLLRISSKPMKEQQDIIRENYDKWKGANEQVDDVLVIGMKI